MRVWFGIDPIDALTAAEPCGPNERPKMIKILLPTDGSARSLDAVRHAMHLIHCGLKARLVVANVQPPANLYEMVVAHDPGVIQKVSEAAAQDLMRPALKLLQAAGHSAESAVGSGDPAHMLIELMENHGCNAIVMSSRGAGDSEDTTPGSVAQALLENCPVPVTLVKPSPSSESD